MRQGRFSAAFARPRRRILAVAVSGAVAFTAAPAIAGAIPGAAGPADETTASQDGLRTGWDSTEPGLTPAALGRGKFGRLFSTRVRGQVYAQPLIVGSTVIAATENDWVYGLDAATGRVRWSVSLGPAGHISGCADLTPRIGVTSTPVYDPRTGEVDVVAETAGKSGPSYHLFAINPRTGRINRQVAIGGRPVNNPRVRFQAGMLLQRPALLLAGRWVLAAFGSHCDQLPYVGLVASINPSTGQSRLWSDESGVADDQGGIWQSGGGLMSDGGGRVFFTSGNGISPAPLPGTRPPGQLADAVVRLALGPAGALGARDFFSPQNAPVLDAGDVDFGAGAPVGLPYGTQGYPHLLVQAGKDGRLFLLNRDRLGGRNQGPGGGNAAVSQAGPFGGQFGHPAAFGTTRTVTLGNSGSSQDYLYYLGKNDYLRELKFRLLRAGRPMLTSVANSSFTFGYTSGSPVVTSSGTNPASAVVWVVGAANNTGARGTLYAFRAVPPRSCQRPCRMKPLWAGPIGQASKFTIAATGSGRVYVGTRDGHVLGFGVRTRAALGPAAQVSFPATALGHSSRHEVSVTASARVTVRGVTASTATGPPSYSVGRLTETGPGRAAEPVTFPVTLSPGERLQAPVQFTPAAPGGLNGTLSFVLAGPGGGTTDVPLAGDGTRTGLYATPGALSFGLTDLNTTTVPVGTQVPMTADITNGGTSTQTVTSVTGPAGPFTATGLPRPGTRLRPGQSIVVQVTYSPTAAGPAASSITIRGSGGTVAALALGGTGRAPVSRLTTSRASVSFGSVRAGRQATASVIITNAGDLPATVTGTSRLTNPFASVYPVDRGLPVNPGTDLDLQLTFRPSRPGPVAGTYQFTWTDRLGRHTITVHLTGTGR